ncbi:MAG: hypothetical protein N2482_03070 [Patescibacteria group bacterium]|nr:hypothetical protein [Patescibacteria group bacterium]
MLIATISLSILLALFLLKKIYSESQKNNLKNKLLPKAIKKILRDENAKFTLSDLKEKNGLYEFQLTWNNQTYPPSYITKDGKMLFTSGVEINSLFNQKPITQTPSKKITCNEVKKSSQPKLTAFVVSNCPYGLQMQRVFKKAIEEMPELTSYLEVKYIGSVDNNKITSMHGDKEAQENLKQICIREEQKNLYWNYVSCYMKKGETDNCLNEAGVNLIQLNSCLDDKKRGLEYAQNDFNLAQKFNIGGSPTLLLNNEQVISEFDFGGRNPNAIKEILCCSADKKLAFCNQEFSKNDVAISFSETEETNENTATTDGGCGSN